MGEFSDGTAPDYEEADCLSSELDDGQRTTIVCQAKGDDEVILEKSVTEEMRWVPVVSIDEHYYLEPLTETLADSDAHRVVEVPHGGSYVEKRFGGDE